MAVRTVMPLQNSFGEHEPAVCLGSYGQFRHPLPQQEPRFKWYAAVKTSRPFSHSYSGP